MLSTNDFLEQFPRRTAKKIARYLLSGKIISITEDEVSITEDEERVYNAVLRENGKEHRVEISVDTESNVEDVYCSCGINGFCIHIASVCHGIELIQGIGTDSLSDALEKLELTNAIKQA